MNMLTARFEEVKLIGPSSLLYCELEPIAQLGVDFLCDVVVSLLTELRQRWAGLDSSWTGSTGHLVPTGPSLAPCCLVPQRDEGDRDVLFYPIVINSAYVVFEVDNVWPVVLRVLEPPNYDERVLTRPLFVFECLSISRIPQLDQLAFAVLDNVVQSSLREIQPLLRHDFAAGAKPKHQYQVWVLLRTKYQLG